MKYFAQGIVNKLLYTNDLPPPYGRDKDFGDMTLNGHRYTNVAKNRQNYKGHHMIHFVINPKLITFARYGLGQG